MHPYEVFSFDEWEIIFNQLEYPLDKLTFLLAHPALEGQFGSKKNDYHFAGILPVLMKYAEKTCAKDDLDKDDFFIFFDPKREVKKEWKSAFLACRLVSRECSKAVDSYLNSHWKKTHYPPSFFNHVFEHHEDSDVLEVNLEKIRRFLNKMGDHPEDRSALLCRQALLAPYREYDEDYVVEEGVDINRETGIIEANLHAMIMKFLQKTGKDLKTLEIRPFFFENHIEEGEQRGRASNLIAMLELTPFLKSLSVPSSFGYEQDFAEQQEMVDGRARLPNLPLLTSLEMWCTARTPAHGDCLNWEQYLPQLTKLSLVGGIGSWNTEYNKTGLFPKLELIVIDVAILGWTEDWSNEASEADEPRLLALMRNLDAPNLKCIKMAGIRVLTADFETVVEIFENFEKDAIATLEEKFANSTWECVDNGFQVFIRSALVEMVRFDRIL